MAPRPYKEPEPRTAIPGLEPQAPPSPIVPAGGQQRGQVPAAAPATAPAQSAAPAAAASASASVSAAGQAAIPGEEVSVSEAHIFDPITLLLSVPTAIAAGSQSWEWFFTGLATIAVHNWWRRNSHVAAGTADYFLEALPPSLSQYGYSRLGLTPPDLQVELRRRALEQQRRGSWFGIRDWVDAVAARSQRPITVTAEVLSASGHTNTDPYYQPKITVSAPTPAVSVTLAASATSPAVAPIATAPQASPAAPTAVGEGAPSVARVVTADGASGHLTIGDLLVEQPPEPAAERAPTPEDELLWTLEDSLGRLPDLLRFQDLAVPAHPMSVPLGRRPCGEDVWLNLDLDVVNVAIYGMTGVGKDWVIFLWYLLLCRRNSPEDVQFLVLDGKGNWTLPQFKNKAHMLRDPFGGFDNVGGIVDGLEVLMKEAARRDRLISGAGCLSRDSYVELTGHKLPILIVIVTDLMEEVEGDVEVELAKIASKARSLGIRNIISFQNPTGKNMAWRSNIGVIMAGNINDSSQDPVVLGLREKTQIRYPPSKLPAPEKGNPRTRGIFSVRHGPKQLLVKTAFLPEQQILNLCAKLPERPAPPPPPPAEERASTGTTANLNLPREVLAYLAVRGQGTKPTTAEEAQATLDALISGDMLSFDAAAQAQAIVDQIADVERQMEQAADELGLSDEEIAQLQREQRAPRTVGRRRTGRGAAPLSRYDQIRERLAKKRERGIFGQREAARAAAQAEAAEAVQAAAAPPQTAAGSDGDEGLPPMPPSAPPPTGAEDEQRYLYDRLYRMMCVPLSFNQIHLALQIYRNDLGEACRKVRAAHNMGPWPRKKPRMSQRTRIRRMAAVPMGFNEIYRVEAEGKDAKGRTAVSDLYQQVTGRKPEVPEDV